MDVKVPPPLKETPFRFLDLPSEIRRQVYKYCLVFDNPLRVPDEVKHSYPCSSEGVIYDDRLSLMRASRRIELEAGDVVYRENIFVVNPYEYGGQDLETQFTDFKIHNMRKLQFVIRLDRNSAYLRIMESMLWSPVLAKLTMLSIVAQTPEQREHFNPTLEQDEQIWKRDTERWIFWLRTILQHIARQLPKSCIVEVDDDENEETDSLMNECFPDGYRQVQTLEGDEYFKRNFYSEDYNY